MSNISGHRSNNDFNLRMRLMASLQQSDTIAAKDSNEFSDNEIP